MPQKHILLDGAIGTGLWEAAALNGIPKEPVWKYNIDHPELVRSLVRRYLAAGSDVVYTNTFGVNPAQLRRFPAYSQRDVITSGALIALEEARATGKKCALSIGPLSEFMEPYGDLEEEDVEQIYGDILSAGREAGLDTVVAETFLDLGMLSVVVRTAKKMGMTAWASMTFESHGKTLMGNDVPEIVKTLEGEGADAVGMNCSFGPDAALPVIARFRECAHVPVLFKPNAGLPVTNADGTTTSPYTPDIFVRDMEQALPCADLVGGCCGTSPDYIRALRQLLDA